MRLGGARSSSNIEDRRGIGGAGMIGGGGIGMLILVLVISFITGTQSARADAAGRADRAAELGADGCARR